MAEVIAKKAKALVGLNLYSEFHNFLYKAGQSMANGPVLLVWSVGSIPSDGQCINFSKSRNYYLLTLQSPLDLFPCFGLICTVSQITFPWVTYLFTILAQTQLNQLW